MKHLKISAIVVSAAFSATFAIGQQTAASAAAATPAAATSAPVQVSAKNKPDRSYTADYADQKPTLLLVDKTKNKENAVTLKSADGKEFVFTDSAGGELGVAKNTKAYRFRVKTDAKLLSAAREAANEEDWDAATDYMRSVAYPIAPFAVFSDDVFPDGNAMIDFFITSMLNAGRYKEAAAYVDLLPVQNLSDSVRASVFTVAKVLAANGEPAKTIKILDRMHVSAESAEVFPQVMEVLDAVRNAGDYKDCALWYTKLSNMKDNPLKNQASLWMIFCDMAIGNKMSAELYLSGIELDKTSSEFSLLQMVKGMVKEGTAKSDIKEALDFYAEGVVYGALTDPWMPELLYKTGMAYKKIENFVASNEIFAQLQTLYPENPFTKLGKKEIVEIKKAAAADDDEYEE